MGSKLTKQEEIDQFILQKCVPQIQCYKTRDKIVRGIECPMFPRNQLYQDILNNVDNKTKNILVKLLYTDH